MAILKKHIKHEGEVTVVPYALLQDKSLSLQDIGMLCTILSISDGETFSIKELKKLLRNDSEDDIATSLSSIESAGYLLRPHPQGKSDTMPTDLWIVADYPKFKADSPLPNPPLYRN